MAANRLQWDEVIMLGYNYKIEFDGKDNGNADALSRLPLNYKNENMEKEETYLGFVEKDIKLIQGLDVTKEVQKDKGLEANI